MSNWTGLGIGTKNSDGDWIEMFFAEENISSQDLESSDAAFEKVSVSDDKAPTSVPEAYLKLHLLSYRLVKPNETNLDGIFGILQNVVWTSAGPFSIADFKKAQLEARKENRHILVHSVDKFPRMDRLRNFIRCQNCRCQPREIGRLISDPEQRSCTRAL